MARKVSDSDSVRRQNRGLVLGALRVQGPQSRTALAAGTGLSHASITAITADLINQQLIAELEAEPRVDGRTRGRPATLVGFERRAGAAALFEVDVTRARLSLVDYGGVLVDRIETPVTPLTFAHTPAAVFFTERLELLRSRNPVAMAGLRRVAISVQGILGRNDEGLVWSPIAHLAHAPFIQCLNETLGLPVSLHKRGRLLAEGARWLDPALHDASVATVFVGSTVAMGMTFGGQGIGQGNGGATEFGHMNHMPNGALCRCGMRGCIEAYAADYGVLRTAYSVPETAHPAPTVPSQEYEGLIARAEAGERAATHAFNQAGRAIGWGLSRMMAVFDPAHILIVGPGARAFGLMQGEISAALSSALVCRVNGLPRIVAHHDEKEPIFMGLLMKTLSEIDQLDFAPLPARTGV
ncbi:ROK family protein [Devosia sp.]|uniref:ROK family protein n=1 Tax=Devosia sp. TaxID=1871048 RepID=UPI002AFFA25A|nr:ROK family protein [Devosia sp.]